MHDLHDFQVVVLVDDQIIISTHSTTRQDPSPVVRVGRLA